MLPKIGRSFFKRCAAGGHAARPAMMISVAMCSTSAAVLTRHGTVLVAITYKALFSAWIVPYI